MFSSASKLHDHKRGGCLLTFMFMCSSAVIVPAVSIFCNSRFTTDTFNAYFCYFILC